MFFFPKGELSESRAEGEVGRHESKEDSERHGLTIMELGVWWPSRVVYMGYVPIGDKGADRVEEITQEE